MLLVGKVKSGLGEACYWMKKAERAFELNTGLKVFHGTLNIELENDYILDKKLKIIHKEEYGGTQEVFLKECKVYGHKSYIVRTDKNMSKIADHPLNVIEIISDINFRNIYNIKDNDEIYIEID